MEKEFGRKRSAKDIIISLITITTGAACLFLNGDVWVGIGIVLLLLGLTCFFAFKSAFYLPGDEKTYSRKIYNFACGQSEMLGKALSGKGVLNLKEQGKGSAVMLYLYRSEDGSSVYAQSYGFSDYRYQPTSKLVAINPAAILEQ